MSFLLAALLSAYPGWTYKESTDPISDLPLAMASIGSQNKAIVVGCTAGSEGYVFAMILFPEYLGGSGDIEQISYRFDTLSATSVEAIINGKQAQINQPNSAKQFIDMLHHSKRVTVQRIEDDGAVHTLEFELPESADSVDAALKRCKPYG